MRAILSTFLALTVLSLLTINAQTKEDSLAVEKACRDYVEGWATGDIDRVSRALSDELVKRSIAMDQNGIGFISNMSFTQLKYATKSNKEEGIPIKDFEPDKEFKLDVEVYDITANYALAKTVNTKYGFFDYCQLAKVNGEWKIINVLWGWTPQNE